jgi:hypothetical protein
MKDIQINIPVTKVLTNIKRMAWFLAGFVAGGIVVPYTIWWFLDNITIIGAM